VKRTPWWTLVSAGAAPVVLAGGLIIAEAKQPAGYDPVRDTISALAAHGATDRWVMTSALAGLGACHAITAMGLRPARNVGRIIFAGGGVATVMVAAFPQPAHGNSVAHTISAALAFTALSTWPVFAARRGSETPLLTPLVSALASVALAGLVVWFAAEIHGGERGLAERAAAGAQAVWPLAVVLGARRALARTSPRRS